MLEETGLDLVWGVAAVSKLIGRSERQTFHMLANGALPGRKIGNRWVISRRRLSRFFENEGDVPEAEQTGKSA